MNKRSLALIGLIMLAALLPIAVAKPVEEKLERGNPKPRICGIICIHDGPCFKTCNLIPILCEDPTGRIRACPDPCPNCRQDK